MRDIGLLLLRVVPALFMFSSHGWGKLMSYSERMNDFPDPLGVGSVLSLTLTVFSEVFCAALVGLGIGTRIFAIPLVITMLVAGLIVHANDPWARQEFPLLFGVVFLTLVFTGGGKFGLGNHLKSKWLQS